MLLWGLLIAALLGAAAAHLAGGRNHAAWARPVTLICLVVALLCALGKMGALDFARPADRSGPNSEVPAIEVAAELGRALKPLLPEHARIVIFRPDVSGAAAREAAWCKALLGELGPGAQVLAITAPKTTQERACLTWPGRSDAYSSTLDQYPNIDAWISLTGLPDDLGRISTYKRNPPPLVAAYVGEIVRSPQMLAACLKRGTLAAIVTADDRGGSRQTFTRENQAELTSLSSRR